MTKLLVISIYLYKIIFTGVRSHFKNALCLTSIDFAVFCVYVALTYHTVKLKQRPILKVPMHKII